MDVPREPLDEDGVLIFETRNNNENHNLNHHKFDETDEFSSSCCSSGDPSAEEEFSFYASKTEPFQSSPLNYSASFLSANAMNLIPHN